MGERGHRRKFGHILSAQSQRSWWELWEDRVSEDPGEEDVEKNALEGGMGP